MPLRTFFVTFCRDVIRFKTRTQFRKRWHIIGRFTEGFSARVSYPRSHRSHLYPVSSKAPATPRLLSNCNPTSQSQSHPL
ncbi:hypothetical protein BDP27DRAFT_1343048 [Rhodocollybia butyracea]|uniref:Uncharacterized protein n=1 Tax=Rhodocollybia butyracea TaxID=206335 RepID=A0A9P5P8X9_9AGAR|nr:hypothetical protein BDP27DRAFT_1343048 [Rhodocollybia butyracea]